MYPMQIVSRGFLKCKRCGTIFTPTITDAPCYNDSDKEPGEWCTSCSWFRQSANENPKCPACGSNEYRKISGAKVRIINHFRK